MAQEKIYDVMILGAGPGGLAAGLYAGRAKLSTLIIEKGIDGGQIAITHDIENYPGQASVDGESGLALVAPMVEQCRKFGCERVNDIIVDCELEGTVKTLIGSKGVYQAYSVIICTGAMTRFIGCKNEDKYIGRGVSYCAVCDAAFFKNMEIYVVGGNNIAMEEALYLSKFARKLTMIHKDANLAGTKEVMEAVENADNIEVMLNTEIVELGGEELLSEMIVKNTLTGELSTITADEEDGIFGLFGFTGKKTTGLFEGKIKLEDGYIPTNEKMETEIPGVYAAGDVRVTPLRQVVTACADGAIAATQCEKYVSKVKKNFNA